MHGLEFVALYTLQHGLPSNAEDARGLQHRHIAFRGLLDEARSKFEIWSRVVDRKMWSRDVLPDAVCELNSLDNVVDERVACEPAPSLGC